MVLGFAGPIYLGFWAVRKLQKFLGPIPAGASWDVEWVAHNWAPAIQRHYERVQVRPELREMRLELMLLGVPPQADNRSPHPVSRGFTFTSPLFTPREMPPGKPTAIGSGAGLSAYKQAVAEVLDPESDGYWEMMKFEAGPTPGGSLGPLAFFLDRWVQGERHETISENLIYCLITRDFIVPGTNDVDDPETGRPLRRMPPLARTMEEFRAMARDRSFAVASAAYG